MTPGANSGTNRIKKAMADEKIDHFKTKITDEIKELAISKLGCNNKACILSYYDANKCQKYNKDFKKKVVYLEENINQLKKEDEEKDEVINGLKNKLEEDGINYKKLLAEHTNLNIKNSECQRQLEQLEISFAKIKEEKENFEKKSNEYLIVMGNKSSEIKKLNEEARRMESIIKVLEIENNKFKNMQRGLVSASLNDVSTSNDRAEYNKTIKSARSSAEREKPAKRFCDGSFKNNTNCNVDATKPSVMSKANVPLRNIKQEILENAQNSYNTNSHTQLGKNNSFSELDPPQRGGNTGSYFATPKNSSIKSMGMIQKDVAMPPQKNGFENNNVSDRALADSFISSFKLFLRNKISSDNAEWSDNESLLLYIRSELKKCAQNIRRFHCFFHNI